MQTDYLLIGQGIAGTLLADFLLQRGQSVYVLDNAHAQSSSMVAAGTVNPITGRRYVKTWLADRLIPYAIRFYQALGEKLHIPIFLPRKIGMVFSSVQMQNDWLLRPQEINSGYVAESVDIAPYRAALRDVLDVVEFNQSGRIQMPLLLETYRARLQALGAYRQIFFDYNQLIIHKENIQYEDITAKAVIFCEGASAIHNPLFNYLPFQPAKGEMLLLRIPDYPLAERMVKHHQLMLAHWKDDLYWLGSSYIRMFQDAHPTEKERAFLLEQAQKIIQLPFECVAHWAGIRPTVRDRRPFLGQHPQFANCFIFNGFGAKGSYTVPYFAEHFCDYLLEGKELMKEVDIRRFK